MSSLDDALATINSGLTPSSGVAIPPPAATPSSIDRSLSVLQDQTIQPTAPPVSSGAQPTDVAPTNFGRAREAANLVTSGLSDKAIAAGAGIGSLFSGQGFSSGYDKSLQAGDPYAAAFRQQHPVLAPLVGAAGMAATTPLMPAAAATLPGRIAQGVGIGAVSGAATGYGQSSDTPGRDTLIGAGLGAAGGAALPVAGAAAAPVLRGFQNKLPWAFPNAVQNQAQSAISKRIAQDQAAGGPSASDMLGALQSVPNKPMSITDVGGENLQALAGNVARQPGPARQMMRQLFTDRDVDAGGRLIQDVDNSIGSGGNSAHDEIQRQLAQRSQDARPLYEKAFAGGSTAPLETLFESAFNDASAAEQAAKTRLAQARQNVTLASAKQTVAGNVYSTNAANQAATSANSAVQNAEQSLASAQGQKAAILARLQQAQTDRTANAPGAIWTPRIQQFLDDPILQSGIQSGLKLERLDALAEGRPFNPSEFAITGTDDAGNPIIGAVPNMRVLDAGKRGLDDMLSGDTYRDSTSGRLTQMGRSIDGVRRAYLGELDANTGGPTGDYAQARAAWAGPSRAIGMIKDGQSFLSMSPDEVGDTVSGLSPSDRQFFQLGVASRLRQNIEDTALNADESKRLINSQGIKNRLRPMFSSDDNFNSFVNNVMAERTMKEGATRILGGSPTAGRAAEDASGHGGSGALGNLAAGAGALLAHEPFAAMPMLYRGARSAVDWMGRPSQAVNTEIARQLSRTTLPENRAILQGIVPPQPSRILPGATLGIAPAAPDIYFGERPRVTGP